MGCTNNTLLRAVEVSLNGQSASLAANSSALICRLVVGDRNHTTADLQVVAYLQEPLTDVFCCVMLNKASGGENEVPSSC